MLSGLDCVVFAWSYAADVMGPIVTGARCWCGEAPRTRFSGRVYAAAGPFLCWHDFCCYSPARPGQKFAPKRESAPSRTRNEADPLERSIEALTVQTARTA